MTLALIFFLILGVAALCSNGKANQDGKTYRDSTRTNVKLEHQINDEVEAELDRLLDTYQGTDNPYDYLVRLYRRYGLPLVRWNDPEDKVRVRRKGALHFFKKLDEIFAQYKAEGFGTDGIIDAIYSDRDGRLDEWAHTSRYTKILDSIKLWDRLGYGQEERRASSPQEPLREEYYEFVATHKKKSSRKYIYIFEIKPSGLTFYNYTMYDPNTREMYFDFIQLLTQKRLKEKGFVPSPDGVHESQWQEAEKSTKRFNEEKEKYPWLK